MPRAPHHHGFSFVELMFAVVVLGIGCVLVASIFPVAIQQTQSNADEAVAAALARQAMQIIAANTTADLYAANDGSTQPFTGAGTTQLWDQVSSSIINPADTRYAWVPFLSKGPVNGTVVVTILVVRRVIHDHYTATDTNAGIGELAPRGIQFQNFNIQADGTTTVDIVKDAGGNYEAVAPNTFLIVNQGGRVWRTGAMKSETSNAVTWSLQPNSVSSSDDGPPTGYASVIGRDWVDAANPSSGFGGPSQDVAVFNTLLQPKD